MSALRPAALAGRTVALAGEGTAGLAPPLARLGARVRRHRPAPAGDRPEGPIDLLVADLWRSPADPSGPAPQHPAGGPLVEVVTAGFQLAGQYRAALRSCGGAILYLLAAQPEPATGPEAAATQPELATGPEAAARAAVLSLTGSLAREWAPDRIRVNFLIAAPIEIGQLADLVGWLGSPAASMLTGQLLDLRDPARRSPTAGVVDQ